MHQIELFTSYSADWDIGHHAIMKALDAFVRTTRSGRLTVSNALEESTNAMYMYRGSFCSAHFSCSYRKVNIMSVVPRVALKPQLTDSRFRRIFPRIFPAIDRSEIVHDSSRTLAYYMYLCVWRWWQSVHPWRLEAANLVPRILSTSPIRRSEETRRHVCRLRLGCHPILQLCC